MGPHITSAYFTRSVRYVGGEDTGGATLLTCESGKRIVVTSVRVSTDNAIGSTMINVTVVFGSGTTVLAPDTTANDGVVFDGLGIPKEQNIAVGDGTSIIGYGAKNENLNIAIEDPAGGAVSLIVTGYQEAFDTY